MKKKYDISGLERHRGRFFLVGLACALFFAWSAFEWTSTRPDLEWNEGLTYFPDEVEVVRTIHQNQKAVPLPKPERFSSKVEIVPEFYPTAEPGMIDTTLRSDVFDPDAEPVFVPKQPTGPPPRPELEEVEAPVIIAENMPRFPGCEDLGLSKEERRICAEKRLLEYIYEHIEYPQVALQNDISGTVVVQFVVEKDGSIAESEVLRDIGGNCGQEVLRVVDSMPTWMPGSQQGRKVRVLFRLPVRFEPSRY